MGSNRGQIGVELGQMRYNYPCDLGLNRDNYKNN